MAKSNIGQFRKEFGLLYHLKYYLYIPAICSFITSMGTLVCFSNIIAMVMIEALAVELGYM